MKEAATIIRELGCKEGIVNDFVHEIRIEYRNTNLLLHYINDENGDCTGGYYDIEYVLGNMLMIDRVCLADGCDGRNETYPDNSVSYTATMCRLVRWIEVQYPEAIERYETGEYMLDGCDRWGCPENVDYGYRIHLKESFWTDTSRLQQMLSQIPVVDYYLRDYYKPYLSEALIDNGKFDFLGTNTKVRRLGYLGMLLALFDNTPSIAKKNLSRLLEQKSLEFRSALDCYKNQKGVILTSKTGASAKPYIKMALEIGVIREMSGHYELGKMGRVYLEALKVTGDNDQSPFELTRLKKTFWLERLLESDYVYLYTLLEYAYTTNNPTYAGLRKMFDRLVTEKLETICENVKETMLKTSLRNAIQRIKGWKKSAVYLEHVIMPRLNWLYDLDMLDLKKDLSFELTVSGRLLFLHLCQWRDLSRADICNPSAYIEAFYMHVANDLFMKGQGGTSKDRDTALMDALTYSFEHFKTMAPNRVTYSVYQAFAKYTLLEKRGILVEATDIKDDYLPSVAEDYVFMYQRYYNDGFIQKK